MAIESGMLSRPGRERPGTRWRLLTVPASSGPDGRGGEPSARRCPSLVAWVSLLRAFACAAVVLVDPSGRGHRRRLEVVEAVWRSPPSTSARAAAEAAALSLSAVAVGLLGWMALVVFVPLPPPPRYRRTPG